MSIVAQADKALRELPDGRYDDPVGNVHTITQAEFRRRAPMAQPPPGQAVRYSITPNGGERPGYQADGEPAPGETRQGVMFWSALLHDELEVAIWLDGQTAATLLCTTGIAAVRQWAAICRQRSGEVPQGRGDPGTVHPERLGPDEQGRGNGGGAAAQRHSRGGR